MKRHKHFILISIASGLLLTGLFLCGLSAPSAQSPADIPTPTPPWDIFWSEWFWNDPAPNTYITATTGSGVIVDRSFLLTQNTPYQSGRIFYLTPTLMDEFSASFSLYLGSDDGGADGVAFIFCPSYDYPPDDGGTLDASCPGGYIVAFDTYETDNDKVYIAFNDHTNRLHTVGVSNLENDQWYQNTRVIFNQGTITVTLDGSNVIDGFVIPDYAPFIGYFGFSAATGFVFNEQLVDNIGIQAEAVDIGFLDGHVYDAETLEPIAFATVTGKRQDGAIGSAVTDPSGYYSMTAATGTYTVTAETDSLIDFVTGVEVLMGEVTAQDLYLMTQKVTFEPTPLHVTLDWQTTDSLNATLENRQPWAYDFEFYEQFGGFLPAVQGEEMDYISTSSPESDADICADALCEEVYGSTYAQFPGGTRDRGNIFEATEDTVIHEIRTWMNFSAPTDMYFFVYEGEALTGEFNKIFEVHITETSTGAQWHSSGPVAVPAQAGKFYYVGASWNGTADYYRGDEPVPITTDCFGILHTGTGDIASYPPAETADNTYTIVQPYHFAIVTGRYDLPWFGQEPLTGTVPASTTEPGEISASMLFSATYAAGVDQPGDYYTTLLVHGDPTLQVPVTMTVLPPVDMGSVTGSVTDNCTGEPIAWVQVAIPEGDPIDETWTDGGGNYTAWLYPGSYELTFSIPGYLSTTEKVDISAGQETGLDVSLVPEYACIEVYPQELEAWVLTETLVFTHPTGLDISNNGGAELNFGLFESEGLPAMLSTDGNNSITSLSGSYVEFDPSLGGDATYIPGAEQTFCFRAESFTDDWEYVYSLWERFPVDWSVSNVYVQGTPTCYNGGTWGTFSWALYDSNPYEIQITHHRNQANPDDHCVATYCFEVISGAGGGALVSWYWLGDAYYTTVPPHYPCSDDEYTPSGQPACDEWINPQAWVPSVIDIPWLWEEPIAGTVPALSTFNVDILFSSEITDPLPLGTYSGMLLIFEDDPIAPNPKLPVSMHVVEAFIDPVPSFESNEPLCLEETAVFTNTSVEGMPPIEYYLWDFGDGVTMTSTPTETVTHDYAAAGSYTVSLSAHQKQTDVEVVFTDTIEVKPLPLADFSYTMDGLTVAFSNASANATSYAWDFGDSGSSDLENPTHTYDSAGVYTVGLTASGECGVAYIEKTIAVGYIFLPLVYP